MPDIVLKILLRRPFRALLASCILACGVSGEDAKVSSEVTLAGVSEVWVVSSRGTSWTKKSAPGYGEVDCVATDSQVRQRMLLCRGGAVFLSEDGHQFGQNPIFRSTTERGIS